jgi:hypothetical protein
MKVTGSSIDIAQTKIIEAFDLIKRRSEEPADRGHNLNPEQLAYIDGIAERLIDAIHILPLREPTIPIVRSLLWSFFDQARDEGERRGKGA